MPWFLGLPCALTPAPVLRCPQPRSDTSPLRPGLPFICLVERFSLNRAGTSPGSATRARPGAASARVARGMRVRSRCGLCSLSEPFWELWRLGFVDSLNISSALFFRDLRSRACSFASLQLRLLLDPWEYSECAGTRRGSRPGNRRCLWQDIATSLFLKRLIRVERPF